MYPTLTLAFLFLSVLLFSQTRIGIFENATDVWAGPLTGQTRYDSTAQRYTLSGAGAGVGAVEDGFHFSHKKLDGDFILNTRVLPAGAKDSERRMSGWMVRSGLEADAAMACAAVRGDGQAVIRFRRSRGAASEEVISPIPMPDVIQLERRNGSFHISFARFGEPFWTVEVPGFDFPPTLLAGLFVCSQDEKKTENAVFDNVRIVLPPGPGFVPYRDYLGSHIEVLDVVSGERQIVYSASGSLQAPNWLPDNSGLIYNSGGLIYRFDFSSKKTFVVNTDFVVHNNNDHVISFDGKMLGLSSSSGEEEFGSLIYTVPIGGGKPVRITPTGPSYLHGWSPDGKWLTYTGLRNGEYDIYIIPVQGGDEIRLTHAPGLDDGSEYSPDGKWIYFNSVRTGSMELWRMRPDGSFPEQLTDDAFQNWFPHVSPDGKWLVFLSYMPEVKADDHPFYKHVYLRIMPAGGGKPRVIAYLYGGQGTINTPSWSPDGKKVAFVSNTGGI